VQKEKTETKEKRLLEKFKNFIADEDTLLALVYANLTMFIV